MGSTYIDFLSCLWNSDALEGRLKVDKKFSEQKLQFSIIQSILFYHFHYLRVFDVVKKFHQNTFSGWTPFGSTKEAYGIGSWNPHYEILCRLTMEL